MQVLFGYHTFDNNRNPDHSDRSILGSLWQVSIILVTVGIPATKAKELGKKSEGIKKIPRKGT